MSLLSMSRRGFVVACAILVATSAVAHHGWSWTVEEQSELTGTIQEIFIGNPHAVLKVRGGRTGSGPSSSRRRDGPARPASTKMPPRSATR